MPQCETEICRGLKDPSPDLGKAPEDPPTWITGRLWKICLIGEDVENSWKLWKTLPPPYLADWTDYRCRRLWKVGKAGLSWGQVIPSLTFFSTGFTPVFPSSRPGDPAGRGLYPRSITGCPPRYGGAFRVFHRPWKSRRSGFTRAGLSGSVGEAHGPSASRFRWGIFSGGDGAAGRADSSGPPGDSRPCLRSPVGADLRPQRRPMGERPVHGPPPQRGIRNPRAPPADTDRKLLSRSVRVRSG